MSDICIPQQYSPYINKSMENIKNLAKSNLFVGLGIILIGYVLIHKIIDVVIWLGLIYLLYLLWQTHKEKIINWLEKLPKPQDVKTMTDVYRENVEHFSTDNVYFDGLNNVISGDLEIPDKTKEIEKFNYEQDNAMVLASWVPNTFIEKIDENGNPIYSNRDNKLNNPPTMNLTLTRDNTNNSFNEINPVNMDGIAENNYGMSLKELYDKSIPNYKKLERPMEINKTNDIIQTNASNLSSYVPEFWSYKNEKELNGGMIGDNLYPSDNSNDLLNSVATF